MRLLSFFSFFRVRKSFIQRYICSERSEAHGLTLHNWFIHVNTYMFMAFSLSPLLLLLERNVIKKGF